MGEPNKDWKTMGQRRDFEDDNQEDNESQESDSREFESTTMRKNNSEGLLSARDDPDLANGNRPKSELLIKKNPRIACVAIEIDPATDDDESNKNNNRPSDPLDDNNDNCEENVDGSPSKGTLKRQTNVKDDATENNSNLSLKDSSNKKRKLQKQSNVENGSPVEISNGLPFQPPNSIKGKLAEFFSTGNKKPLKSYSCPQDYDYDPKVGLKRQCMSLDEEPKSPSAVEEPQPAIRHRPLCLKSSLKGEDTPSRNHVPPQQQQSPLPSPKKAGVKLIINDDECMANAARERRSVAYSRKNSLMPQVIRTFETKFHLILKCFASK